MGPSMGPLSMTRYSYVARYAGGIELLQKEVLLELQLRPLKGRCPWPTCQTTSVRTTELARHAKSVIRHLALLDVVLRVP